MKLKIVGARLAFSGALFEPEQFEGKGDFKYGCSLLVGPERNVKVFVGEPVEGGGMRYRDKVGLLDAIETVGKEKWGAKWASVKKIAEAKDLNCLHDGDLKDKYAGFAGQWYVSCSSPEGARPTTVDSRGNSITQRDGVLYPGCYVIAMIDVWAQDNAWGQRVNAQIRGVQFLKDGDAFSGGAPANANEFEDVSDGADADDIG